MANAGTCPCHAHPEEVRFLHHRRDPRGVHAVVNFDLPVAARPVPAHRVDRGLLAVDHDAVVVAELALPFDEAGSDDVRPADFTGLRSREEPVEHLVVVPHVADRGDSVHELEQRGVPPHVTVHLEEPSDQRSSGAVDGDLSRRRRALRRLDGDDLAPPHEDGREGRQRLGLRIEDPDVLDANRASVPVGYLLLDLDQARGRPVGGRLPEPNLLPLVPFANDDEVRADVREEVAVPVDEQRLRRQIDPREIVPRDLERPRLPLHGQRLPLLEAQGPTRERAPR